MRYSFKCPKCESTAVIEVEGSSMNTYQKIPLNKWSLKNAILDRYIYVLIVDTPKSLFSSTMALKDGFKKL